MAKAYRRGLLAANPASNTRGDACKYLQSSLEQEIIFRIERDLQWLVPIAGKPMLQIWFERFRAAGITDVLVNLHTHANQVRDFVNRHTGTLRVTVSEERELLGSAGTLRANRQWLGKGLEFVVLYGDVLTNLKLRDMIEQHRRSAAKATLGVYHVENPKRCGIVTTDSNNKITAFVEKPEHPTSDLAFAGIMVASPCICDLVPPEKATPDIGLDLLPQLLGQMYAYLINDYLIDVGTRETYDRARREWPGIARTMMYRSNEKTQPIFPMSNSSSWTAMESSIVKPQMRGTSRRGANLRFCLA